MTRGRFRGVDASGAGPMPSAPVWRRARWLDLADPLLGKAEALLAAARRRTEAPGPQPLPGWVDAVLAAQGRDGFPGLDADAVVFLSTMAAHIAALEPRTFGRRTSRVGHLALAWLSHDQDPHRHAARAAVVDGAYYCARTGADPDSVLHAFEQSG